MSEITTDVSDADEGRIIMFMDQAKLDYLFNDMGVLCRLARIAKTMANNHDIRNNKFSESIEALEEHIITIKDRWHIITPYTILETGDYLKDISVEKK